MGTQLQTGDVLGHYKILSPLGKGGMGEVWRALDTKLQREVAIKTLPESLSKDPDRLARLEREAKLLAALNHPNIAVIYGLEEHSDKRFLVLELVEGATLAERLTHGAPRVDEALKLALQIAESLEAAHEKGIVHRDLKPANIKVTPEGRIKVLDFGLAKALEPVVHLESAETTIHTQTGVLMGTPAYMSPEQARGETVGRQSDIWSFGVVLFELLTAVSPFAKNTTAETLATVLGTDPDDLILPSNVPSHLRRVIRRCLEKDPKRRLQHMGDVRIEIEDGLATLNNRSGAVSVTPLEVPSSRKRPGHTAIVVAIVLLAAFAGWFFARRSASPPSAGLIRLSLPFSGRPNLGTVGSHHLAISQDGSRIVYASQDRLWVRGIDQKNAVPLAASGLNPFFSPNGEWVAAYRLQTLVKAPVDGGEPVVIAMTTERSGGGTWAKDGTIVYATTEGLYRVSDQGGPVLLLVKPDRQKREKAYAWPQFLPDERFVLFTIVPEDTSKGMQVALLDLKTLEIRPVLQGGSFAHYAPTGHLVFASGSALKTIPFDLNTHETQGDATPFPDVEIGTASDNGAAEFALSAGGTLVFLSTQTELASQKLVWVNRQGKEETLPVEPRPYSYARLSPDGTRVALDIGRSGSNRDIWILDLKRWTQVRLTDGPTEDMLPVWSPDGRRVFFASDREGNFDIYSQAADGATGANLEFARPGMQAPQSFTPDGTQLILVDNFKDTGVIYLTETDRHLKLLLDSDFDERLGDISPDGKWLAYESNESGNQFEIFVRPFPNVKERREKISINGGRYPLWGPKGRDELYYVNLDGEMMAASVKLSPDLTLGRVTKLFSWVKPPATVSGRQYDVSPIDGRFLSAKRAAQDGEGLTSASVILNWTEALRNRDKSKSRR